MTYPREERETTLVYDDETREWTVYSCVPKHVRKLQKLTEVTVIDEGEAETPAAIRAVLPEKFVKMSKPRQMSGAQRQAAAERLREVRNNAETGEGNAAEG